MTIVWSKKEDKNIAGWQDYTIIDDLWPLALTLRKDQRNRYIDHILNNL